MTDKLNLIGTIEPILLTGELQVPNENITEGNEVEEPAGGGGAAAAEHSRSEVNLDSEFYKTRINLIMEALHTNRDGEDGDIDRTETKTTIYYLYKELTEEQKKNEMITSIMKAIDIYAQIGINPDLFKKLLTEVQQKDEAVIIELLELNIRVIDQVEKATITSKIKEKIEALYYGRTDLKLTNEESIKYCRLIQQ